MKSLLSIWACVLLSLITDVGTAAAQQPGRTYKIGWLWLGRPGVVLPPVEQWTGWDRGFLDVLRDNGFLVGKNLVIDVRSGNGDTARLAAEAEALVDSGVDVILTFSTPPTVAAMQATKNLPIVFEGVSDPVEKRIIASLARPGGNVTGMATLIASPKQWQLLHEIAPAVRRGGMLSHAAMRPGPDQAAAYDALILERMKANAGAVGIEPTRILVSALSEVEIRLTELASRGAAGVVINQDPILYSPQWRPVIMEIALKHRLPTSCISQSVWASSGCLVTYIEDAGAIRLSFTKQVIKILRGEKPADIPVEQPTTFKLVINAKTAKALDLTVPQALLVGADEVIE